METITPLNGADNSAEHETRETLQAMATATLESSKALAAVSYDTSIYNLEVLVTNNSPKNVGWATDRAEYYDNVRVERLKIAQNVYDGKVKQLIK
jgi:hypothetical protein